MKLNGRNVVVENDVKIKCNPNSRMLLNDNESENDSSECIYKIKAINVDWEGVPSCMHVFIDNSDIVKLQEAKTNLKCQKIMFSSASHEFRTPLNAIVNSFVFLKDTFENIKRIYSPNLKISPQNETKLNRLTANMAKFTKMGNNSSLLLLALIEDILSLSKMEAGTFKINKTEFLLSDLIDEVFDVFELQCESKRLELSHKVDPVLGACAINSDFGRLKQVLLNVVSNALKFTFEGYILLKAEAKQNDGDHFIQIEVVDSGIGIKQEDQPKLFKLFGMVSQSNSLNPNGSGIGLTVSKGYIEAMGGTMRLESEYGRGTSVIITIPCQNNFGARSLEDFDKFCLNYDTSHLESFDEEI